MSDGITDTIQGDKRFKRMVVEKHGCIDCEFVGTASTNPNIDKALVRHLVFCRKKPKIRTDWFTGEYVEESRCGILNRDGKCQYWRKRCT